MEHSCYNMKKFLIFSQKKVFLIFRKTEAPKKFFIFQETELFYISANGNLKKVSYVSGSNFTGSKNEKKTLLKSFLYFRKWNLQSL